MSDNKELHLLENYLSDNDITIFNYVDKLHEYNNFQILKETLDDRFYSLYTKKISKSKMNDNSYNFAGFLDVIDKKIYNTSYEIEKILESQKIHYYKKEITVLESDSEQFSKYNLLLEKANSEESVLLLNQKILESMELSWVI